MWDISENRQHHAHIYAPFAAAPVSACVSSTSPSDLGCGSVTRTSIVPPGSSQGAGMADLGLTSSLRPRIGRSHTNPRTAQCKSCERRSLPDAGLSSSSGSGTSSPPTGASPSHDLRGPLLTTAGSCAGGGCAFERATNFRRWAPGVSRRRVCQRPRCRPHLCHQLRWEQHLRR